MIFCCKYNKEKEEGTVFGSRVKDLLPRQHSRNVLRPSSLELATSLLGASRLRREKLLAFRELFGAKALYFILNFF